MADDDLTPVQACTKCNIEKPASREFFSPQKLGRNGLTAECKACRRQRKNAYDAGVRIRAPIPDRAAPDGFKVCSRCADCLPATTEHFYRRGVADLSARCRQCRNGQIASYKRANPVKAKAWYWNDRERQLELRRARYRDPEQANRLKAAIARWRKANRSQFLKCKVAKESTRRARKRAAGGKFTQADIAALMTMQRGRCWWCQCKLRRYHVDHRIPLAKGGTNQPDNLILACPKCNVERGAKMPWEASNPRLL